MYSWICFLFSREYIIAVNQLRVVSQCSMQLTWIGWMEAVAEELTLCGPRSSAPSGTYWPVGSRSTNVAMCKPSQQCGAFSSSIDYRVLVCGVWSSRLLHWLFFRGPSVAAGEQWCPGSRHTRIGPNAKVNGRTFERSLESHTAWVILCHPFCSQKRKLRREPTGCLTEDECARREVNRSS